MFYFVFGSFILTWDHWKYISKQTWNGKQVEVWTAFISHMDVCSHTFILKFLSGSTVFQLIHLHYSVDIINLWKYSTEIELENWKGIDDRLAGTMVVWVGVSVEVALCFTLDLNMSLQSSWCSSVAGYDPIAAQ